jgi:hypothetical protein
MLCYFSHCESSMPRFQCLYFLGSLSVEVDLVKGPSQRLGVEAEVSSVRQESCKSLSAWQVCCRSTWEFLLRAMASHSSHRCSSLCHIIAWLSAFLEFLELFSNFFKSLYATTSQCGLCSQCGLVKCWGGEDNIYFLEGLKEMRI